ncbi:MAG: hypothetical protein ACMG6E_03625 [Candidatus Roizmanbacteria bacterium]
MANVVKSLSREVRTHHFDYTFLVLASLLTLVAIFYFQNQRTVQMGVLVIFGLFYVLWGTIHHIKDRSFHLKVLLEYILISLAILLLAHNLL